MALTKAPEELLDKSLTSELTITTADNTTQLTLKSTDADGSVGPRMDLRRDSSSPAASDTLGQIRWFGKDAGGASLSYAHMASYIVDPTDGSEDGKFEIDVRKAGTARSRLLLDETETVFNQESQDIDFRVESDGNANMLFVDAGNDRVMIGGNDPEVTFEVDSGSANTVAQFTSTDAYALIKFKDNDTSTETTLGALDNDMVFRVGDAERMRIEADGGVAIGDTSCVYAFEVHGTSIFRGSTYTNGFSAPLVDNTYDLGHSSYRWDDIYATNSTIQTSDKNLKNNITESDLGLSFIKELKPVSYKWKEGKSDRTHYGLVAQDVETVLSDMSKPTSDFAGFIKMEPEEEAPKHEENPVTETRYGLRYNEFIAPLIKAVQEQQTLIETLQTKVKALEEA